MFTPLPTTPERWAATQPLPHVVIDGLWDDGLLQHVADEFPDPRDPRWITYPDPKEHGKRAGGPNCWGIATNTVISYARSAEVRELLEEATGIGPLTADTLGGGMHMTSEGGRLECHVDFNIHPEDPGLERRLNLLVFLNKDWHPSWGGTLYLGRQREVIVTPEFNRTVLFETSSESWHGHPDPVVGNHLRKSIAVYYYAPVRDTTRTAHTTIWHDDTAAGTKVVNPNA